MAFVMTLAVVLTACGAQPGAPAATTAATGAAAAASTKDTIVIAQGTDAISLDPAKHTTFPTQNVLWHVYEPLVMREPGTGKYLPALATEWKTVSPDTWEFKLRSGVKFHNGDPLTADDVKFTFDRALDPATKNPTRANLTEIIRVEAVDQQTVRFVTKGAYPLLLYRLSEDSFSSVIVPSKYVKADPDALATKPIGTGPYRFVSWKKDERLELELNPDYWGPKPAIKKVTFRPIPETAARIAELKSGGADLIVNVPPEQMAALDSGTTKVDTVASDFVMMVVFNTIQPGPLQNKKVRQALNHAVDADAIVKSVMGGTAQRIAVTLPRDAFGYPKDLQPYPYDPAKARQLLAEAGYPTGFKVPFISRSGRYLKDKEVVETVAGFLQKVGVDVDIKFVEPGVWSDISNRKGRDGLSYPGWSGPDAELVWYPILHTGELQSYFSNKELDSLLEEGRTTLDTEKRAAVYRKAGALIKDEAPHIPLFQPPLIFARNAKLAWTPRGDEIIDLRKATFR